MNENQITEFVMTATKDIAALWESTKSAHRRIDENDRITAGIHELAKNIAAMAAEIKLLTERMDNSIERIEHGLSSQGERIGNIEKAILTIGRNEKAIEEHKKRLDEIDKAPAYKWKTLVSQMISLAVATVFGIVAAKFL